MYVAASCPWDLGCGTRGVARPPAWQTFFHARKNIIQTFFDRMDSIYRAWHNFGNFFWRASGTGPVEPQGHDLCLWHVCTLYITTHMSPCGSTGPVPEARPKKFFQNCATRDIWNSSYRKKFGTDLLGRGKMFAMPGVGPRPACHVPDPRDSCQQRTLWFSHVIVSRAVNLGLQWYLKIGIC